MRELPASPVLLEPENRSPREPDVTLVVPAMNEEIAIGEFVDWCHQGLAAARLSGQILIVDSSGDETPNRALAHGAEVLRVPRRGLGQAYRDAIPFIRGRFVIMGDADLTYDFRLLRPFWDEFQKGAEFVMGSRFLGVIDPGAMPSLHRYFGTPVTTWVLNRIYSSRFSDIHCGMRGISHEALVRMNLQSQSWEYASEMVLKSVRMELRTAEVPIHFMKDPEGRQSHHKRAGWFSPWQAGWINLRAMFVFGADFFLIKPGLVLLLLGSLLTLPLTFGVITVGPVTFSLHWQLLGLCLLILGLQSALAGVLARLIYDFDGRRTVAALRFFAYDRMVLGSGVLFLLGLLLPLPLVVTYLRADLRLTPESLNVGFRAVTGLALMMVAFILFTFTLVLHALAIRLREGTRIK